MRHKVANGNTGLRSVHARSPRGFPPNLYNTPSTLTFTLDLSMPSVFLVAPNPLHP